MTPDVSPSYHRSAIAISLAVGVIGITFGVLAEAAGFDLPRTIVMSALVFTGASQFAAVGVIDSGGSGGAAVGSALLVGVRNAFYGPVVKRALPASAPGRLLAAQFVIDETTAMASAQDDDRHAAGAFWLTAVVLWTCWNAGSLLGALLGAALGQPETWGLDAAFPVAFMALLMPHVRTRPGRAAALGGALLAAVTLPLTPAGIPLAVAVLATGPAYLLLRRDPSYRPGSS